LNNINLQIKVLNNGHDRVKAFAVTSSHSHHFIFFIGSSFSLLFQCHIIEAKNQRLINTKSIISKVWIHTTIFT